MRRSPIAKNWTRAAAALAAAVLSSPAFADILVGLALPATGPKSELASVVRATAEDEIAALNRNGGIAGQQVRLSAEGDDCSAEGGTAAAARLVAQGASLIIGHPCSNAAIAAQRAYAAAGVPFVAIGARHPDVTAKRAGPAVFRAGGRDDRQAAETVEAFASELKGKRIAVVHDRTAYAKGLADGVTAAFKANGVTDIVTATIVAGERDYDALAAQIKAADVAALYFAGFTPEARLIFEGLRKRDVRAMLIGCDALAGIEARLDDPLLYVMTSQGAFEPAAETRRIIQVWARETTGGTGLAGFGAALGADKNGDLPGRSFVRAPRYLPGGGSTSPR